MKNKKLFCVLGGLACGFLNGLFGSGGGVAAVLFLNKALADERRAHATATLTMLILSAVSAALYLLGGRIKPGDSLIFLPAGLAGAVLGSAVLRKIKTTLLKKIFGGALCAAAAVIFFK